MSAAIILEKLNQAGIHISFDDDDLLVNGDDVSTEQIAYLREHKAKLVEYLRSKSMNLDSATASACRGLSITPDEVRGALAPEDIECWRNGHLEIREIRAFAKSLLQQRDMGKGIVPAFYTEEALCRRCGPVWLWIEGTVDACPWCQHRAAGVRIPRPSKPQ